MPLEKPKTSPRTVFYPASYLVMTVTSLLFLVAITSLGSMLINYWINGVSDILNDTLILYWIASLAVVTPLHLLAYWSVRHTDKRQVTTFSLRVAHGLLGAYLLVVVGTNILLGTWLLAMILNTFLGSGDVDKHFFATLLSLAFTISWLYYATKHFGRARTDESRPKYYVITVSVLSVLVIALSLIFPVTAYKDVASDFKREKDLTQINQAVGDYVDANSNLPSGLNNLQDLDESTKNRLSDYEYTPRGETKFGIFGYTLCTTFAKSKDKSHDVGWNFASHGAGKQCFTRTTISFSKLNEDMAQYFKNVDNGAAKLRSAVQNFLLGAKSTVDQEITGVENFASSQVKQLEGNLEGLEGGTTDLQREMLRLEGNLNGLEGDTGDLAQDFAAVEKFLHDLGCLFGGCK